METKVVKVDGANVDPAKIQEAAALVDAGGLVAFPTETVYGIASRVSGETLRRLNEVKARDSGKAYTLHIGRRDEVGRYVPTIGLRAGKLIGKAWPGPLTIVFELDPKDVERQRRTLKREVFQGLYRDNSIGIRCPDNAIAAALLVQTRMPVVAPSANVADEAPAVDARDALAALGGKIDMVLDGGLCKYGKSSTVARMSKEGVKIVRGGVYSDAEVKAYSHVNFLCVCTGNTCRSPMAEGIFRKYLAEKLECEVDRLDEMGYTVASAGILDMAGSAASGEAVAACAARGVDIRAHKSQPVSVGLIRGSDRIFAMEQMHQARVVALCPDAADRCVLLAGKDDIADPIGQRQAVYDRCADLIEDSVRERVSECVL
ncbi:MAG: threonylcarbamoyl-AMP synthase [Phycisphaerae bacterium]|nr:threonylcarbamoyl-AMP synthase [Phycisphaerae bacterium]